MKTLTYGTLPDFDIFHDAFITETSGTYEIHLSANDARMFHDVIAVTTDDLSYSCLELYALLDSLGAVAEGHVSHGEPWTDEAVEWAGNFASCILTTLGFEWV